MSTASNGDKRITDMPSGLRKDGYGPAISRRNLLRLGTLLGIGVVSSPVREAYGWSSWTNVTSPILKSTGMGDCVHEDLVQIAYARMLAEHGNGVEEGSTSFINPFAGSFVDEGQRSATIDGDVVCLQKDRAFANQDDLSARLYRENLAYLRIGSFWNDAAANTVIDFGYSALNANKISRFSGSNRYTGAWDVGQHIRETHVNSMNAGWPSTGLDALVQFTMNERNNFIHGLLSTTADGKQYFKQADMKKFALQWMGVAYEFARTGQLQATRDVTREQATHIYEGFIDTYGQYKGSDADVCVLTDSLSVGNDSASRSLSHRQLRLRAFGMVCHTLEDFWCPAHTCRTYVSDGSVQKYSVLAFSNYKKQNGSAGPINGYHMPFDRYARTDAEDSKTHTDWRKALTTGIKGKNYPGTETLQNALKMQKELKDADRQFNTLGMNETITSLTKLFQFLYDNTPWDEGVRDWVDVEVLPVFFDSKGQSLVCDAGRRSLHTPTFIIAPIKDMKKACRKLKRTKAFDSILKYANQYDQYQKWTHAFFSGNYNSKQSTTVTTVPKGKPYCSETGAEKSLESLVLELSSLFEKMSDQDQKRFLALVGSNGCHNMDLALSNIYGMLQEFNIELRGGLRSDTDDVMERLKNAQDVFRSGVAKGTKSSKTQSASIASLFAPRIAFADEYDDEDELFETTDMEILDIVSHRDGAYLISVRDLDSLETSVMRVPVHTPGRDKLEEGLVDLSISYLLFEECEDDIDYQYIVTGIDYPESEDHTFLATGKVTSVTDGKISLTSVTGETFEIKAQGAEVPEQNSFVTCYYTFEEDGSLVLVDFVEEEEHESLGPVWLPVVKVCGSGMWLLDTSKAIDYEGEASYGGHGGNDNYLYVDYGRADICPAPEEGHMAQVYYHKENYHQGYFDGSLDGGDTVFDIDDVEDVSRASATSGSVLMGMDATEEDLLSVEDDGLTQNFDSIDTPGYIQHGLEGGDGYWTLDDDPKPRLVADRVVGSSEEASDDILQQLFGDYYERAGGGDETDTYHYVSNGDGKHWRYTTDPNKKPTIEKCTYNSQGVCVHCGYRYVPQPDDKDQGGTVDGGGRLHVRRPSWNTNPAYTWVGTEPAGKVYGTAPRVTTSTSSGTATASPVTAYPVGGGTTTVPSTTAAPTTAGVATPATGSAAAPSGAAAATPAAAAMVAGGAGLANTADLVAGLDGVLGATAAAGAVLTGFGSRLASKDADEDDGED